MKHLNVIGLAILTVLSGASSHADEVAIRKTIAERLPAFPKIDEISRTPVRGIYELRVGTDVLYVDENGDHLIRGEIIETKSQGNLTEARVAKLAAIDVASLPLNDAIVWKQGTGVRKLVVFADPNCGYCKRFERDMLSVSDVTVYTFLYPVLGTDSREKSRDIWCAKDKALAWRAWMLDAIQPARATGGCDTAVLERNLALGRKHRITGTPALVFANGKRIPGALAAEQVRKELAGAG